MEFVRQWKPYVTEDGSVVCRPVLKAFLRLKNGRLGKYDFVVDSGADISLGPRQLARDLGLDWRKGERTELTGISKRKVCRLTGRLFTVEMAIPEVDAPLQIPICLASVEAPFLLGREGFFDAFRVEFDKTALEMRFSRT